MKDYDARDYALSAPRNQSAMVGVLDAFDVVEDSKLENCY